MSTKNIYFLVFTLTVFTVVTHSFMINAMKNRLDQIAPKK